MKNSKNIHWLLSVGNILRSRTSDLRELALIAGRDPKTFYMDSDLSGADVRGQDLRGMIFSDKIDLSKIEYDQHTIFGPEITPPAQINGAPEVLVWISERDPVFIQTPKDEFPFDFEVDYGGDIHNFEKNAEKHDGPSFVVLGKEDKIVDSSFFITVVPISDKELMLVNLDRIKKDHDGAGIIFVSYSGSSRGAALSGPVRDLLELFCANWPHLSDFMKRSRAVVFMRERGSGVNATEDAQGRLYQRAVGLRLLGNAGLRNEAPHSPFAGTLFHELRPIAIRRRRRSGPRYRAMALFESENVLIEDDRFKLALERGLIDAGWDVAEHGLSNLFVISANNARFAVFDGYNKQKNLYQSDASDQKIVVFPWLSDRDTVRHFKSGGIVVSASDLLAFDPERPSIWSLVDIQAQRIVASRDIDAKSEYFKAVLYTSYSITDQKEKNNINDILENPQMRINAKTYELSPHHSLYELNLFIRGASGNKSVRTTMMSIDDDGIQIV